MPDSDAPIRAFQDDLTEGASRDRITQAKEHRRVYVHCRTALELRLNKLAIEQDILLSTWRADSTHPSAQVHPYEGGDRFVPLRGRTFWHTGAGHRVTAACG